MSKSDDWNEHYKSGFLPWDTGQPSSELQATLTQHAVAPCRVLEIGCGTGTNSVWLAQQGFEVTAVDVAPLAIEQAQQRAQGAGVTVKFAVADILQLPDIGGPFDFFFDRGCYHHAGREGRAPNYAAAVAGQLVAGGRGLILAGNAREPRQPGPPVVSEEEIRSEIGQAFNILDLHEFRFDEAPGLPERFLGWSCFVEKR